MSSADKELIERFKALDAKASPGPWEYESQESGFSEEIIGYMTKPDIEDMLNGKDCDMALSVALRNDAVPLICRLTAQIEALQAEIERLKGGIGRAAQKLEASDLIDLAHSAINDRYGAAKACIQKGLRELEALK